MIEWGGQKRPPEASATGERPSARPTCLGSTIRLAAGGLRGDRWSGAPLGIAAHAVALATFGLLAVFSVDAPLTPALKPLVFWFAAPPPPPQLRGDPSLIPIESAVIPRLHDAAILDPPSRRLIMSDEILSPEFDVSFGADLGFDQGLADGMDSDIPGGVVGGVPGGLVGGVLGGKGTVVPPLPKPDVGPSPIRMPLPSYTKAAVRDNVSGAVVLRVLIDEKGKVQVLEVRRSIPTLDEEAIQMVESRWLFEPATKNGRPIPAVSDLVVRFRLY
ncbi:MAG TPA: energy transducer TonB [Vicinamibacteria bacterium]|nr:energy transducer TonB [Vicinamibacteria bacterium]